MIACDYIFVCTIPITILIIILIVWVSIRNKYESYITNRYKTFVWKSKLFLGVSIIWLPVYYWLYIASVLCTIIVIYVSAYRNNDTTRIFIYSILSLFLMLLELVIQPRNAAIGYRQAYMSIDSFLNLTTIQKESETEEKEDLEKIVETLNNCEIVIENVHR